MWHNTSRDVTHVTTQHNTTQHNTTQHNTTQHNTTQHNMSRHVTSHRKFQCYINWVSVSLILKLNSRPYFIYIMPWSSQVRLFTCPFCRHFRCVPDNKRAFANGIQYISIKTLGFLPGPILFGHVIDSYCTLWQDTCGEKGRCFDYDIKALSYAICVLGCGITCKYIEVSVVFKVTVIVIVIRHKT